MKNKMNPDPSGFYCSSCELIFQVTPQSFAETLGVVHCPQCGKHRNDTFNRIGPLLLMCSVCNMKMGSADDELLVCPNRYLPDHR